MDTQTIIIWSIYLFYILIFMFFYKKYKYFEQFKVLKIVSNKYFNLVLFGSLVLLFIAFLYFNSAMSDIPTHTRGALGITEKGRISGRFLFALSVAVFSFFNTNIYILISVAIVLLSLAILFKYIIAHYYSFRLIHSNNNDELMVKIGALISVFVYPLIIYPVIPRVMSTGINVWHNGTTIFLMPFALLLFFESYKFLQGTTQSKTIWILILLVFLNIAAKPSFFFVFCVVFPLFSFYEYRFKKQFFISLIPVIFGLLLIGSQYLFYYTYIPAKTGQQSTVEIKLLYYFYDLENIFYFIVRFISNYAFPLLFLVLYFNKIKFNKLLHYILSLLFVALMIKYSIYETGPRAGHGNFGWQVAVTGYIWFLISLQLFIRELLNKHNMQKKDYVLMFVIGLQIVSFIIYFILWSFFKMW